MADYGPAMSVRDAENAQDKSTLQGRYTALSQDREPYLRRARSCAALTLSTLIPPRGFNGSSDFPTPFQSIGARGCNNLAAKLLLALFPPNAPFFKFRVDPYALAKIQGIAENAEREIEQNLLKAEEAVQSEIEAMAYRPYLHEATKHLVVAGNSMLYMGDKEERPCVYHLPNYVVRRCDDDIEEIIIEERVDPDDLPADIRNHISAQEENFDGQPSPVCLYTGCFRQEDESWEVYQEVAGMRVPDSEDIYSEEDFPYIVLRGEIVSGENYGRSYVDGYLGDLQTLEGLTQVLVEGSAAACAGRFLVNPNGVTNVKDISNKPNWSFVPGKADDVTVLQLNKYGDFQVAGNTANRIEDRLATAFLLNSSIQRQAERVTAEEIRFMAQELEQGLGGIYSLLSHEFQLPFVNVLVARMTREKRLPKLPKDIIRPSIVTGIEALGRGNDLNRLSGALSVLTAALGPDGVARMLRPSPLALRVFNASGVRAEDFVKTEQELAAENQQAQMMQMAQKVGPNVVNAMSQNSQAAQQEAPQ